MAFNFYKFLREGDKLKNMPLITISNRNTDKRVTYNKNTTRLDRIAGNIYGDETMRRIIMWANPEFFIEFDIPDNTVEFLFQ